MEFPYTKYLLAGFFMLTWSSYAFAQSANKIISKDTINLRGIVYQSDGKPAKRIFVQSKQLNLKYNRFNITATTDSNGYFTLNGAKPYDTLSIAELPYKNVTLENKGARYVVIYLPPAPVININTGGPVVISATRIHPKITPTFNIEKSNEIGEGIELPASFIGGLERFEKLLSAGLYYPQKAIDLNIEGTVQIGFDVGRDGVLTNFKVLKGIG